MEYKLVFAGAREAKTSQGSLGVHTILFGSCSVLMHLYIYVLFLNQFLTGSSGMHLLS